MPSTVDSGDQIEVALDTNSTKIPVTWSQSFRERKGDYYSATFKNASREGTSGQIFVAVDYLDGLNKLKHDGKIKVDESFQYGQKDKQGNGRFLVYHNKENRPYQRRFVAGIVAQLGTGATGTLQKLGFGSDDSSANTGASIMKIADSVLGDYLHTMGGK